MYAFEHHIRVMLEFRAMDEPVEISVPWNVLFYLDTHAKRKIGEDGMVIYRMINDEYGQGYTRTGRASSLTAA